MTMTTWLHTTTILLVLAFANPGAANFCYGYKNINVVAIQEDNKGNFSCSEFNEFDRLLGQMGSISHQSFKLPTMLVGTEPAVGVANFNAERGFIDVTIDRNRPQDYEATKKIFVHEVGHFIFEQYVGEVVPLVAQRDKAVREVKAAFNKIMPKINRFRADPGCEIEGSSCNQEARAWADGSKNYQDYLKAYERRETLFKQNFRPISPQMVFIVSYHWPDKIFGRLWISAQMKVKERA